MSKKIWINGDRVYVARAGDEIMRPEYVGATGTIIGREVGDCGATPKDPMLIVRFDRPVVVEDIGERKAMERDGFWTEELEVWT